MIVNPKSVARWSAVVAKWVLAGAAAINAGRLNTPDTSAGPVDYLKWVISFASAAVAAKVVESKTAPDAVDGVPLEAGERDRRDVGLVIGRMVADGKHDAAAALIAALKQGGGK